MTLTKTKFYKKKNVTHNYNQYKKHLSSNEFIREKNIKNMTLKMLKYFIITLIQFVMILIFLYFLMNSKFGKDFKLTNFELGIPKIINAKIVNVKSENQAKIKSELDENKKYLKEFARYLFSIRIATRNIYEAYHDNIMSESNRSTIIAKNKNDLSDIGKEIVPLWETHIKKILPQQEVRETVKKMTHYIDNNSKEDITKNSMDKLEENRHLIQSYIEQKIEKLMLVSN